MRTLNMRPNRLSGALLGFALLSGVAVLASGCSDGSSTTTTTKETTIQQSVPVAPTTTTTTTKTRQSP